MDDDRKYRHRGYMDSDRDRSSGRRPSGPRPPRPEGPRGRGADQAKAVVFACHACGEKRRDVDAIRFDSTCGKCGADLHACSQCAHFDTSARFECVRPIPARIAAKKLRNTCTFYEPARSFDLTGSRAVETPQDARAAFDALFKK
jgi:hypothetical protein